MSITVWLRLTNVNYVIVEYKKQFKKKDDFFRHVENEKSNPQRPHIPFHYRSNITLKISKQKETKKILFKEAIRIVFINQSVIIMLFTTRKETAKKMLIYPLKKLN